MVATNEERKERQDLAARMPWITRRKVAVACDGIKWGSVAGIDLYWHGKGDNTPPRGIQPKARCKHRAYWHIVALGKIRLDVGQFAKAADFCWFHLITHMFDGEDEEKRAVEWLRDNGYPVEYETELVE